MCPPCPRLLLYPPRFQYTLVLLPLYFRRSSFFSTTNLAPHCGPLHARLAEPGNAEDGERNPKDNMHTLRRLDQPERYGVNSVAV